jgi:hypothetical protein
MRLDPGRWLATLRRRRRSILCALLPAFALSVATGPTCAAMRGAPTSGTTVELHDSHDARASHHHGSAPTEEPAPAIPCPHCPLESGAANAGHATCVTADAQESSGAAPAKAPTTPPPVFLASWLLPAARASPPLIGTPFAHTVPPADSVTLTIRHCVLLI